MLVWITNHPRNLDLLGSIPSFLDPDDSRQAKEQINERYQHGGGWHSFGGFKLNPDDLSIKYPNDPPMYPIATTMLGDELIAVYQSGWVMILQPDSSYEIARLD